MLAHRDYSEEGRSRDLIFDDRIEVPGGLLSSISGRYHRPKGVHQSRNYVSRIAGDRGDARKNATNIRLMKNSELAPPEILNDTGSAYITSSNHV